VLENDSVNAVDVMPSMWWNDKLKHSFTNRILLQRFDAILGLAATTTSSLTTPTSEDHQTDLLASNNM
jgi:hypothetical protein